jgi:CheY-like chemotaxis protein
MRIPLAALGPVSRRRRLGILLPLLALAAAVAGVLVGRGGEEVDRAARLAAPDTALWIRIDPGDAVWDIARDRLPDVRAWAGDELALAFPAQGRDPLFLVAVEDRPGAERFLERLPEGMASAFAGDFLLFGPQAAVDAAADRAGGPSLADSAAYRRAAGALDRAPVELFAPAAGARALLERSPAVVRAFGAFTENPAFVGLAARMRAEDGDLRISARVLRTDQAAPPQEFAPALQGRVPASAAAFLAVPGAGDLLTLLERGAPDAVAAVRRALPDLAGLDLDTDVVAPLGREAAVTLTARGATPVITLTARSDDAARTREALARLQGPLAEQLGAGQSGFRSTEDGFTLDVTPSLRPSYALDGDVLIASTDESGLAQRTLARRGLAQEPALRAVADQADGRIEALAFADLRQLLALGERTGLTLGPGFPATRDDLREVRAAGAVVRREESDSTAELFLEIP